MLFTAHQLTTSYPQGAIPGLRRLDLKACDPVAFWKKNLLVLVGEEFQDLVTSSVGGISDYSVSGKIREAKVALID